MREQTTREYLKTIFALEMDGAVRGAYIAREMDLTKATVSVALKALEEEGYLIRETDRSVRLTEKGRHLARESIHQTVRTGRSYHELVQHIQAQESDPAVSEQLLWEREQRWLDKERAAALLEAHRVLSERYYCVRVVDLAHYLGLSSTMARHRLKRLEQNDYLRIDEDTVVELTDRGERAAERLFTSHAQQREALRAKGMGELDAAREAIAGVN